MLRDIKTRMGASYFGFLFSMMIPLGHIAILLTVYIMMGRRAPIGTDVPLFLATAILPFAVWSYTHQKNIQAFSQNKPLTAFPIVKFQDIFIARALVELLNSTLIVTTISISLMILGSEIFISDPPAMLYTFFMAYMLGVSTGLIFGLFSQLVPFLSIIGYVLIPIYWVTSGALAIPGGLPPQLREVLRVFPLAHVVEYGRAAFYPSYLTDFPNLLYVHAVIAGNLFIGLMAERFLRPTLTTR